MRAGMKETQGMALNTSQHLEDVACDRAAHLLQVDTHCKIQYE